MRNPEDTKYVWDEENFNIIQKNIMKKEKRYFIEIVIKDSDTLEPVRSISTSSDYPESVLVYPHTKLLEEVDFCVNALCSTHFGNN